MSKPTLYRPELDMLRFFAFLAVFFEHSVTYDIDFLLQHHIPRLVAIAGLSLAHAGMYGVDIFFVLSSYLITSLLLKEKTITGTLDVKSFYIRRILRIWPLYYLFIVLVVAIPFLNIHSSFSPKYIIPCLLLVGNWGFVAFGTPSAIVAPLWSISVEEQFYLLWPPLVARLTRKKIIYSGVFLIVLASLACVVEVLLRENSGQIWMDTFTHIGAIGAGLLIASVLDNRTVSLGIGARVLLILVAACCLGTLGYLIPTAVQPSSTPPAIAVMLAYPVATLSCSMILVAFIGAPVQFRPLQYLGKISYGLYILHTTAIAIVWKFIHGGGEGAAHAVLTILAAFTLTVALAGVSYHFIESPFLRLKARFTRVSSRPV